MMRKHYVANLRALVDNGGQLDHAAGSQLLAEVERLSSILNRPVIEPFLLAAKREAAHQVYRWGEEHDATKTAWDWFWLLGYLGSKAAHAVLTRDWEKAKHHTITAAAMLANWHRQIVDAEASDGPR